MHVHVCTLYIYKAKCMYMYVHVHSMYIPLNTCTKFIYMYIHVCTMYRVICTDLQILVHVVRIPDECADKKQCRPGAASAFYPGCALAELLVAKV